MTEPRMGDVQFLPRMAKKLPEPRMGDVQFLPRMAEKLPEYRRCDVPIAPGGHGDWPGPGWATSFCDRMPKNDLIITALLKFY
jgi:hypothetical protein